MKTIYKTIMGLIVLTLALTAGAAALKAQVSKAVKARKTQSESAESLLKRAVDKINLDSGIAVSFTLTMKGQTASGTMTAKGERYYISAPGAKTWYDGKEMAVWSKQSDEVTLWKPTLQEVRESNPLLYLRTVDEFAAAYDPKQPKGEKIIILTPKKRNTGVKSARLTLNASTLIPKTLSVATTNGTYMLKINTLKSAKPTESDFRFSKSKCPGATVNRLH